MTGEDDGWPTQREVPEFFGAPGTQQVMLDPPYPLYLYDGGQRVKRISVHEFVHDSVLAVMTEVVRHYGEEEIHRLGLDRYFGSLNVRNMRGSNRMSMHAWGIAIDFDANRNQLKWNHERAVFARPEYEPWWQMWEAEGWTSLGRKYDYDWMHVEATSGK